MSRVMSISLSLFYIPTMNSLTSPSLNALLFLLVPTRFGADLQTRVSVHEGASFIAHGGFDVTCA